MKIHHDRLIINHLNHRYPPRRCPKGTLNRQSGRLIQRLLIPYNNDYSRKRRNIRNYGMKVKPGNAT